MGGANLVRFLCTELYVGSMHVSVSNTSHLDGAAIDVAFVFRWRGGVSVVALVRRGFDTGSTRRRTMFP